FGETGDTCHGNLLAFDPRAGSPRCRGRCRRFRRSLHGAIGLRQLAIRIVGLFPTDLARVEVVTYSEEHRLAHHAVARPLRKLDFGHELRANPGGFLIATRWLAAKG